MSNTAMANFDEIPRDDDGFSAEDRIMVEDEFYKLSTRKLELKCYFFPSRQPRYINLREIKTVYFRIQGKADLLRTKMWGMYGTRVWWASDMKRGLRSRDQTQYTNVVIDCGERMLKGFTVTDFVYFRSCLEQAFSSIAFVEHLPEIF